MSLTKGWKYWSVFILATFLLSQIFAAFRHGNLGQLIVAAVLLAVSFLYLSFVMYAVEKKAGRVAHPIRLFEKWLNK